eukprot:CAMPEP_0183381074 /NCGR_PEP_ID=MMETSP0164_2-20130417/126255_1 /TAXON_ID=221442 /ORGANISM="Coccolithus pelagicus ssp braarudi, Strain PLY182g" /LENGTH=83 /DNA_ID=CAMNT_0025558677 /DNA_START=850 /DNA_END=1101 /DNA_ORIENTATION=+
MDEYMLSTSMAPPTVTPNVNHRAQKRAVQIASRGPSHGGALGATDFLCCGNTDELGRAEGRIRSPEGRQIDRHLPSMSAGSNQ